MIKHRYDIAFATRWSLIFFLCGALTSFAQEKQKIPAEFFVGKWAGKLEKNIVVVNGHQDFESTIFYQFENIQLHLPKEILPIYNANPAWFLKQMEHYFCKGYLTITGRMKYTHIDHDYCEECKGSGQWSHVFKPITVPVTIEYRDNRMEISFDELPPEYTLIKAYPNSPTEIAIGDPIALGGLHIAYFDPSIIKIEYEKQYTEGAHYVEKYSQRGTLYKIEVKKLLFPKDIKPDEPIKTDKKTQLQITMPSKDVIKVAPNTKAVIRSESWIEVMAGKIHKKIKKFIEQRRRAKYLVNTPTCVTAERGTEFTIDVEDDSTTTIIVLDGEVEVSDKENKTTVIVKKNQKSIVKPGALPTEPEAIDPENILNWWE